MTCPTVLIAPGFGSSSKDDVYCWLEGVCADAGLEPVFLDVGWSQDAMSSVTQQIEQAKAARQERPETAIFGIGHSLGAVSLLCAAPEICPEAQLLCGMSPIFKEEYGAFRRWKRLVDAAIYGTVGRIVGLPAVDDRPELPECGGGRCGRITFVYGEREYHGWFGRWLGYGDVVSVRTERIPNSEEVIVPDVGHDIGVARYRTVIEQELRNMLPSER